MTIKIAINLFKAELIPDEFENINQYKLKIIYF